MPLGSSFGNGFHLKWLNASTSAVWWVEMWFALYLLSSLCVFFLGRADIPIQLASAVRVEVPIQPGEFYFFSFFFVFLPMVSQDYSLVFFLLYQ
jgi:hypothetical protein